ncbi:MAG: PIN domain-containing protein [bacterium]|nr:PIN domain-containing protein [bacterium]
MKNVFIDTSAFKALIDEKDDFHVRAKQILDSNSKVLFITSNYIFDESLTLLRVRCGLSKALDLRALLVDTTLAIRYYRTTVEDEAFAWDWFIKEWKDLSFTDCVTFAMMKRLEIDTIFTFDNHFKKAGFKVLM